ncbi:COG4315 family predicted lipoprotein [Streptomyces qinglanensis]|uniref:COG4315 family predicted lipoprotein n=1 Tax=Streptomyces qinglanensis TaxID=943816 RepID=UPI003D7510B1
MRTTSRTAVYAGTAVLCAAALGGCSDGGGDGGSSPSPSSSKEAATVEVRSSGLGSILADGSGRTLYLFEADKSRKSTCEGSCAKAWPPVVVEGKGGPRAGDGAESGLLGTTERKDGSRQLTYDGHPLYRYQGGGKPGDTAGQGLDQFGAEWFVLDPSGKKITDGKKKGKKPSEKPQESDGGY